MDFDEDLQLKDFENAVQEGFDNIELLKRFTRIRRAGMPATLPSRIARYGKDAPERSIAVSCCRTSRDFGPGLCDRVRGDSSGKPAQAGL